MLFDSHAHYDDSKFDHVRYELLDKMQENNVGKIMNACASIDDIDNILAMSEKYDFLYASVGVHPSECGELTENDILTLKEKSKHKKVKAIGEIGLDYYYDDVDPKLQKFWFEKQIEFAKEVNLPIIVHDRDAHKDVLDILKATNARDVGGVVHCFSGSPEMTKEILDMGFYIAFGGVLTFKNARKAVESVKYIPIDKILIETDSPYLAPEPLRGSLNSSLNIHLVRDKLAQIKGISIKEVEDITYNNAINCYHISEGD